MKQAKRIILAGLLVAALGSLTWLVLRPNEPVYKGKPLSFWLQGYDPVYYIITLPKGPPPASYSQAEEAVGKIGTNAIPTLLRMLQQRDSGLKIMIIRLLRKQLLIKVPFVLENRNQRALDGFFALGSGASNAVPRLIEIFDGDLSLFPQQAVPVILANIGPAAAPAIPAMLRGIVHTNEIVRINAIYALGQIHISPALVVPALISCLNDPDAWIRAHAANSLGKFGKDAQSAVPALVELLRRQTLDPVSSRGVFFNPFAIPWWKRPAGQTYTGQTIMGVIKDALRAIDPEAAAKAGVK